jgi:hypothetical protein
MALQTINIGASANDGTVDPLRTVMDKINDNFGVAGTGVFNVMHPDYGAVGNGVANDTTAINNASAAASAAGGGVVRFPYTPDSYNFTFTLPDAGVIWKMDGAGNLIDRTKVGGASGLKAQSAELHHFAGDNAPSYRVTGKLVRGISEGSGDNLYADSLRSFWLEKKNYITTQEPGELVCLEIFTRQGGPTTGGDAGKSSTGGFTVDVLNVDGAGFAATSEQVTRIAEAGTGTILRSVDTQFNVLNSRDDIYCGVVYISQVGTQDTAIQIQNEVGSSWGDALRNAVDGFINFKIGTDGKVTTKTDSSGNTEINFKNTSGVLDFKNAGGTNLFSIGQSLVGIGISGSSANGQLHILRTSSGATTSGLTVGNAATAANTGARLAFNLSTTASVETVYVEGLRTNSPIAAAGRLRLVTNDGSTTHVVAADERGCLALEKTNTAAGTTGNQTISKASGRVNIAAAGTSVTVTNSCVTAASNVVAWLLTADATATSCSVQAGSGSFVITLNAAATAEVALAFILRCGKVILAFGPCANVRQANAATALVPPLGAAR